MLVPGAKNRSYATDHVKRLLQSSDLKQNRNELPNFIKNSKYDQENPSGGKLRTDLTRQVFAIRFADVSLTLNIPRGVLRGPPLVCYWLTSVEINKHKIFDTNNA